MPELPEVEAARRAIAESCLGKKIISAIIADDSKVIDGVSPGDFRDSLVGKTIVGAHRKGKNMWIQLDSPPFPSFQFGMAGAIYIKGVAVTNYKRSIVKDTEEWPSKYSKLFVKLDDGLELSFTDKRRFAKVRLLKDPALVAPISELGPDALLEPMNIDDFVDSLSKRKTAIKALLLDQSYIAGIGNWIADEVLYQARIHPLQIASSLSKENCVSLHKSIKEVLEISVEVGADSTQFPDSWIFHSREKKPGKAFVDGKAIEFITAGGRTTAYVPELQKLPANQVGKVSGKPRKQLSEAEVEIVDESLGKRSNKDQKKTKSGAKRPPSKRKAKVCENDDDDEDDNDDGDNDEILEKYNLKNAKKRGIGGANCPSKKGNIIASQSDEGDNEEENPKHIELKKGQKNAVSEAQGLLTTKEVRSKVGATRAKRLPMKREIKQSGSADNEEESPEMVIKKGRKNAATGAKRPLTKRKANASESDNDVNDGDTDEDDLEGTIVKQVKHRQTKKKL